MTILHIDSSAHSEGSVSRQLSQQIVDTLTGDVVRRDLAQSLPHVSEAWIGANFTPADDRTPDQTAQLAVSQELVGELMQADTVVIGLGIYNFGIPAALKAWIDQVCRAGLTFKYTENGPIGLLEGKRAIIAVASGGTQVGSEVDFATGYMRHVLGFIGITDVTIVAADQLVINPDEAMAQAQHQIAALAA